MRFHQWQNWNGGLLFRCVHPLHRELAYRVRDLRTESSTDNQEMVQTCISSRQALPPLHAATKCRYLRRRRRRPALLDVRNLVQHESPALYPILCRRLFLKESLSMRQQRESAPTKAWNIKHDLMGTPSASRAC